MKYEYLLLNFLTVLFPIGLSFDKRVVFYKNWKYVSKGLLFSGVLFLVWDILFTAQGVWSFNPNYIIGINFFGLPLEEILFFLTVPFACIFIYECLNYYIKVDIGYKIAMYISNFLILLSVFLLIYFYDKLYTAITFGLLLVLIVLAQYVFKVDWLSKFYRAYVVVLIPFYIINGILTATPIVIYNNAQNMGQRVGTIPFEDHFYCMAMLLLNIGFYEAYKNRNQPKTV